MKLEVNGQKMEGLQGETILAMLNRHGKDIPTLCHIKNLFPSGACRLCVVEVEGERNLIPSCAAQIREGMKIQTHSPRVLKARKTILELLLSRHPDDCMYCDRNMNCELQSLSEELNITERKYSDDKFDLEPDNSSPSIYRNPEKCILCGRCVRVCEEVMSVSAIDFTNRGSSTVIKPPFGQGLNVSTCVNCGQCVTICPTGALTEKSDLKELIASLTKKDKCVVVQHAPSVSVTIGEAFGFEPGVDVDGLLNAALRKAGFKFVFDTSFTADLTIMEEGSELVERIKNGGKLPMLTSCSPGWIKFVEQFYPEYIDNLSSCKSPQQMMGAIIKSYFAKNNNIDPKDIISVSIMPCTAKKFESSREEMIRDGMADVDISLTTRELIKLFKTLNIDLKTLKSEEADLPFGERSSAGKIFGVSGGVMEAAVRSAYYLITGHELKTKELTSVRNLSGVKEGSVKIGDTELKIAAVNGLANARKLLEEIKKGQKQFHFIEVMTCPGGCIGGGGQPIVSKGDNVAVLSKRMKALYNIDHKAAIRCSHHNPAVKELYDKFLEKPLGNLSHKLLHTTYRNRKEK